MKFWSFEATFLVDIENKNFMYKQIDIDQIVFRIFQSLSLRKKLLLNSLITPSNVVCICSGSTAHWEVYYCEGC